MSSVFKGKPKADPGQETGPSIRVEETPLELPRERSFRHKAKAKLQNIFTMRSSNSRATSRGPSERGKSQGYLPVLDVTPILNIGDKKLSVEIKDDLGESLNTADRGMGSIDRAFEEVLMETEDQSVNIPMSTLDEIGEQAPQDSIQASNRQVQVMRAIGGGVSRERKLDKGKGRNNQPEGLGGAGGLAAIPGHLRQVYDNAGTAEADDREISRIQLPYIGAPSGPETTHFSTQGVASHLHGAHHFTIGGNPRFENNRVKHEYYYSNQTGAYDISVLKEFVSFGALYNSSVQDATRRVHPGTRQRVLKRIQDWIDTPSAKERIFWLHGPAGVGKSAIAQTIARSCAKGKLVATFFFYRSDPGRNDGNRLFTTLAWQFASTIPATKNALINSLNECPDIPMTDIETQFEELIVKPFLELKRSGVRLSAPVVIIDGVDECSRPEAHIQDTIDIFRSVTLPLDLAKLDDANHDIEIYLRAEFSRIATEQDLDPAWPGEEIIQELVYKASGQFVYASTVIKFVGDEYSSAESQLDIIRGLKPASSISPFAELYKEILGRQRDPVFLKDFLSLFIGRSGTGRSDLPEDDAMLMNASNKELHRKLRGMRSLLKFEPYLDVHHRSFLDFLQDSSRSGQYHISKQAGTRRYLDFIVASLVQYASTVIEGHYDHKIHFSPEFEKLTSNHPASIVLPVEEWQQALQPLVDLQNKLLTLPNFRSAWEFYPCEECIGFHTIRDLLLHLAFLLGASDHVLDSSLMVESHADRAEEIHNSLLPLIPTETDMNTCLSSLLLLLRRRNVGILLDTDAIPLACSLLHFDHAEIAMRVRSIFDAQNLVDVIDELINNKHFCSDYSADMSCKAVHLALEISARVPVLPRSLFSKGTVSSQHGVWLIFGLADEMEILDPCYIMRVLWVYEDYKQLFSVVGKVNENDESLRQWRKKSIPSFVTRIRVMLQVAKALRYFHLMGIVLHDRVDSDDIFLDSELHARFLFFGLTIHYVDMAPHAVLDKRRLSHEANIFLFGCLFYEICFNVEIDSMDRLENNSNAVAKCPSTPEIRDDEWQLIQRCCTKEPKSRPTMDEVVREMEAWDITPCILR